MIEESYNLLKKFQKCFFEKIGEKYKKDIKFLPDEEDEESIVSLNKEELDSLTFFKKYKEFSQIWNKEKEEGFWKKVYY